MAVTFKLDGAAEMVAILTTTLPKRFPEEVARALAIETDIETEEVALRTPVRSGLLKTTVRRVGPSIEKNRISASVTVGGATAFYAFFVHEDLDAIHLIGQAKFLESVLIESRNKMAKRIAKRVELKNAVAR